MNRALSIKNWKDGGNSYVLKGNSKNKWIGFQETVIKDLKDKFGNKFNLVIWTDKYIEDDYYSIPFKLVKHLFVDKHKTTGKFKNRWTAVIKNDLFLMHSNQKYAIDISEYYAKMLIPEQSIIVDEDYFIENAKAEINVRVGQSKFRKRVLKNFDHKCAVTGIKEPSLLKASHIIPWAHKKEFRADVSNGIALYTEIDALFDQGYISVSDDYELMITTRLEGLSTELKSKLIKLDKKKIRKPNLNLKTTYLKYHRKNIFIK